MRKKQFNHGHLKYLAQNLAVVDFHQACRMAMGHHGEHEIVEQRLAVAFDFLISKWLIDGSHRRGLWRTLAFYPRTRNSKPTNQHLWSLLISGAMVGGHQFGEQHFWTTFLCFCISLLVFAGIIFCLVGVSSVTFNSWLLYTLVLGLGCGQQHLDGCWSVPLLILSLQSAQPCVWLNIFQQSGYYSLDTCWSKWPYGWTYFERLQPKTETENYPPSPQKN